MVVLAKIEVIHICAVVSFVYAVTAHKVEDRVDGKPYEQAHNEKFEEKLRIFAALVPYLVE
jgi:hypothetical protein